MAVFLYLLDTARVNSQTLWALNNNQNPKSTNSFEFAYKLETELAFTHIKNRNSNSLPAQTKKKISTNLKYV